MKDMYIDYGGNRRRRRNRLPGLLAVLVLALVAGLGGYFGAAYYNGVMESQKNQDSEGLSAAAGLEKGELETFPTQSAEAETGVYGLWYSEPEQKTEDTQASDYIINEEVWMADFVDNRKRVDVKGIYVSSAYMLARLDYAIDLVDTTELNAIVVDVKTDSGFITYKMDYELAKEIGATTGNIYDINAFVKKMHDHGIYLIARIVTLKDPKLADKRPDLALHKKDGSLFRDNSGLAWVNPYKDEVWDYLTEICRQCASVGFDEVNLDYIRFSTDKGMAEVDFGPEAESRTRIDVISDGIKHICENIKPLGIFVSADVYGAIMTSSVDAKIVGQSYFRMSQYLDYICPMVYPSHYGDGYYKLDYPDMHPYELVYNAMMDSRKVLYMIDDTSGNKATVRPWLQDFTASWVKHHLNYADAEVRAQIDAVYDAGYNQWLLWNAGIKYHDGALLGPES